MDYSALPKTRVLNYHHIRTPHFTKPWKLKLQHKQLCVALSASVILFENAAVTNTHITSLPVHHHENQPGRSHPEPEVEVHTEPEEGRLQDLHLGHQRQPG